MSLNSSTKKEHVRQCLHCLFLVIMCYSGSIDIIIRGTVLCCLAIKPPYPTPAPCGVPETGYMSEVMAKVAAYNIVSSIRGKVESDLKDLHFGGCMVYVSWMQETKE